MPNANTNKSMSMTRFRLVVTISANQQNCTTYIKFLKQFAFQPQNSIFIANASNCLKHRKRWVWIQVNRYAIGKLTVRKRALHLTEKNNIGKHFSHSFPLCAQGDLLRKLKFSVLPLCRKIGLMLWKFWISWMLFREGKSFLRQY